MPSHRWQAASVAPSAMTSNSFILSVTGVGLPIAIAQPMWLRLRRSALIAELLGHDTAACKGEVIGAAFAVFAAGAPAEIAIQTVWRMYCGGSVMRFVPMGALVTGLADSTGKAAAQVVEAFQPDRSVIPKEHWHVPLEKVSIHDSLMAVGNAANTAFATAANAAELVATEQALRAKEHATAAAGKAQSWLMGKLSK